jgi:hypothetical protein
MKLLTSWMTPEIAKCFALTALVLQEFHRGGGDQQKNPLTRIFQFYRSRQKSQFSLKYLQPKFCLASVLQNCVASGFQRNGSLLCSLCCIGGALHNCRF